MPTPSKSIDAAVVVGKNPHIAKRDVWSTRPWCYFLVGPGVIEYADRSSGNVSTPKPIRFEARELKSFAEHVSASELRDNEVYFSLQFVVDGSILIPILEPLVFIGRDLDDDGELDLLYFQKLESFRGGVRYRPDTK